MADTPAPSADIAGYLAEIRLFEREYVKWKDKSRKIVKRYKDERDTNSSAHRFNCLWSNVNTLLPALYARQPKPDISRRFKDADPVGRVAADVLERSTSYFVSADRFGQPMRQSVIDYLLPGRGSVWARYVPHLRDMQVQTPVDVASQGEQVSNATPDDQLADMAVTTPAEAKEPVEEVYYEEVVLDYVHWDDFGHNVCRVWDEVYLVWRRVFMARAQLVKRFGEKIGNEIPLDHHAKSIDGGKVEGAPTKACVYECWDKTAGKVTWLHKDVPDALDKKDDPLELEGFWPCPRPLFTIMANDSLEPIPDYVQYQDQALQLDELTQRITNLSKALKVAGVYDSSAPSLARLLSEGVDNKLLPVDQWMAFAEKGGIQGAISFLPIKEVAEVLIRLMEVREKVKAEMYEVTGIGDIIRGQGDARATATQEKLKGQFATLRLSDRQAEVQRFARDAVSLMAQIIAGHFGLDTIKEISGVKLLMAAEKQQIQQQQAMQAQQAQMQQPGQQPGMPPQAMPQALDQDTQELMDQPTWEEVYALLKNKPARCFRIDIETDSTIKSDQEQEKQERTEFLKAAGQYVQQTSEMMAEHPESAPLLGQMLMFAVRSFPVGKELEGSFQSWLNKVEKTAQNPPPKPNPEMLKLQGQQQLEQIKLQNSQTLAQFQAQLDDQAKQRDMQFQQALEQSKQAAQGAQIQHQNELEAQREQFRIAQEKQLDAFKAQLEARGEEMERAHALAMAQQEHNFNWKKAILDNETKVLVAELAAQTTMKTAAMSAASAAAQPTPGAEGEPAKEGKDLKTAFSEVVEAINTNLSGLITGQQASHQELIAAVTRPKRVVRDPVSGDLTGVE